MALQVSGKGFRKVTSSSSEVLPATSFSLPFFLAGAGRAGLAALPLPIPPPPIGVGWRASQPVQ